MTGGSGDGMVYGSSNWRGNNVQFVVLFDDSQRVIHLHYHLSLGL